MIEVKEEKPVVIRTLDQICLEYDQHLERRLAKMTPRAATAERRRLDGLKLRITGLPLHDPDPELTELKERLRRLAERAGIQFIAANSSQQTTKGGGKSL